MGRGWRPIVVGAAVTAAAFALAQARVFEPDAGSTPGPGGDATLGAVVFERTCAGCHGSGAIGGSPGPSLVGTGLDASAIAAVIEQGAGVMPAGLVSGEDRADVVAYVAAISNP
jgi:mono/diheme cytochrome c family protein